MKKILFVAAIAAITFTSCKKDDDNNSDCFDCTTQGITAEYCHTDGDDFYTVTLAGHDTEFPITEGTTWEEIKAGYTEACNN